jgi:prolipoprotein diacylglyceryltransferase
MGRIKEGNMITISIDPIIFSIGYFHIRWYSLILSIAIIIGAWLTVREAGRFYFLVFSKNNRYP